MKQTIGFLKELHDQRTLVKFLAKREIQSQYIGSFLGVLWAFIHPLVLILIYWMVFGIAFNARSVEGMPFVVWLTAGMSAWFFVADVISGSCNVILNYTNFIKKTTVKSHFLPIVKIIRMPTKNA